MIYGKQHEINKYSNKFYMRISLTIKEDQYEQRTDNKKNKRVLEIVEFAGSVETQNGKGMNGNSFDSMKISTNLYNLV